MVNKVTLVGNLGADVEMRYTQSGMAVANIRIATSTYKKDQDNTTEWHSVVAFDKLAELCEKYLGKGNKAYVEGRLQTRKWQDRDGNDRYTTEIVANDVKFLDARQAEVDQHTAPQPPNDQDVPF